jgi:enoyl-CoA hydratase
VSGRIRSARDGAVARLTIDRPERANALTPELAADLRAALAAAVADRGVRVVALRGAGDRAFCAGFDLDRASGSTDAAATGLAELMADVERCPVPVVAVLNGPAVGAGFELACRCDLRVARADARVGLPAVALGVPYRPDGIAAMLAAAPATRRLLLTGRQEPVAAVAGLADVLTDATGLDAAADELLAALCAASPAALGYTARLVRALRPVEPATAAALAAERDRVQAGTDLAEALAARVERRVPTFADREDRPWAPPSSSPASPPA